jgi:hypothetical protein
VSWGGRELGRRATRGRKEVQMGEAGEGHETWGVHIGEEDSETERLGEVWGVGRRRMVQVGVRRRQLDVYGGSP